MGKKGRCYLCGAKLQNGYCRDCGLDNWRSQKIRYRLNESNVTKNIDSFEELAEEQRESESKKIQQHKKKQRNMWVKTSQGIQRKNVEKARLLIGGIGCVVVVIALLYAVMEANQSYREPEVNVEYTDEPTDGYYNPDEWDGSEPNGELVMTESPDTYEFAERELSPVGAEYVGYVEYGEYIVGSQIPEGTYTIRLKEGNGYVNVDDLENTIYLWQDFGTNAEYDEILVWQDVRL